MRLRPAVCYTLLENANRTGRVRGVWQRDRLGPAGDPSFSKRWPRWVLTVRSEMSSAVGDFLVAVTVGQQPQRGNSRGVSCTWVTRSASFAAADGAR